ncbi:MAG: pyridoxal phosphate-dependent aminotransferase [Phototrophicaceae bacterium]
MMNNQLQQITQSFTIQLADRVRQLQRDGVPIIGLQTGDPDFNTPQAIIDAAYQAMNDGFTHYSNSRGLPALREAIANRTSNHSHVSYDPETEILVTHGAIHAYYIGLQAIINPQDEVLVPDPSWQTHANMVKIVRGVPVRVMGLPENNFLPTLEAWQASITPKTKALVINTPCNPTGSVASRDYLQALVNLAITHDLFIISDEVYDNLLYGVEHVSTASIEGAKERTLLLNSMSKTYAMTGWRIGYLCAPVAIINNALKASQHSITNVAEFTQRAAIVALTDADVQIQIAAMRDAYAERRGRVLALYDRYGGHTPIEVIEPQGAFYFFLDARQIGLSSNVMAERLLTEAQVALVPGSAYGEAGEGFLRMTTAASLEDIEKGFSIVLDWARKQ